MLLLHHHQLLLATAATIWSAAARTSAGNCSTTRLQTGRNHPQALLRPVLGPPRDSPQESRQEQAQEVHAFYGVPLLHKQEEIHKQAVRLAGQI